MVENGGKWQKMTENGRKWQKMDFRAFHVVVIGGGPVDNGQNGRKWSKMAENGLPRENGRKWISAYFPSFPYYYSTLNICRKTKSLKCQTFYLVRNSSIEVNYEYGLPDCVLFKNTLLSLVDHVIVKWYFFSPWWAYTVFIIFITFIAWLSICFRLIIYTIWTSSFSYVLSFILIDYYDYIY